ncbi:hypothetical protein PTD2_06309 [Pseudoalteromonas tunicata D2]|uniref:Uncharacterized protein n=1 Tax=Pseudoalteromonas tunicata D2 TaxID=87626 RepID=A4C7R7_9GAMM|nr:hypothetical protein PTD2_06309 [Pseudoalteromonas tunicata D2]
MAQYSLIVLVKFVYKKAQTAKKHSVSIRYYRF